MVKKYAVISCDANIGV